MKTASLPSTGITLFFSEVIQFLCQIISFFPEKFIYGWNGAVISAVQIF